MQQLSLFDDIEQPSEREEILALRKELEEQNYNYYVLSAPVMSDREFDEKMHRLEELESRHPELFDPKSPTQHVGSDIPSGNGQTAISDGFEQVQHRYPMLSLANTYSEEEIRDWLRRVYKGLEGQTNGEIVCELKYDGLSISLWYERGRLVRAVTRGDGVRGDDVVQNIRTIPTIPQVLPAPTPDTLPPTFEIRGEVLLPWTNFDRINRQREADEEPLFANPRNAASGTLKLLNPETVRERGLDAYLYYVLGENLPGTTHYERLERARNMGFHISDAIRVCHSVEEVMDYIHYWDEQRKTLPVATDARQAAYKRIRVCRFMMEPAVGLHVVQSLPAQRTGGVGEILIDKLLIQPHRLEKLGALIGLQCGHAHLGGDLQNARREGLIIVRYGVSGQLLPDDRVGQVRAYRPRAIGDQHGQLVGVPGLAALQNDGDLCPLPDVDQMLLQRRDCQQRGDDQMFGVHAPIGEYEDVRAVRTCRVTFGE